MRKDDFIKKTWRDNRPGTGKPDTEGKPDFGLSVKALRDLPKSSYSIKADPYEASLVGSKPYPIIAPFNKKIGGNYKGVDNLDGGNAQQYANATNSGFLYSPDFMYMKLPMNYRNLPINAKASEASTTYCGKYLVDEMRKAISETVSILQSTTFTSLAINNYAIETDLCMGSATTKQIKVGSGNKELYINTPDVVYACAIFYQLVMQAGLNVFNWHNAFRLKMGEMLRRSWNRETPTLNALFGLFQKKSFIAFLQSFALSFEGEFIDLDEMKQTNMLTLAPSSRSGAMLDPVLEVGVCYNAPTVFKIYTMNSTGTEATLLVDLIDKLTVSTRIDGEKVEAKNYFNLCGEFVDLLSAEQTIEFARGDNDYTVANTRFNSAKYIIDALNACMTRFKPAVADIREVFETMSRTGAINWTKGFLPSVTKDVDASVFDNLIIDDIFRIACSSADTVEYDDNTKRWRTFSLWNLYDGIPEYDAKQGGAFLTLSLKNIDVSQDLDFTHYYLPIRFTATDGVTKQTGSEDLYNYRTIKCVDRKGNKYVVNGVNSVKISTDDVLARLAPLASQNNLMIRVPSITGPELGVMARSHVYRVLTQVFGLCQIPSGSGSAYDISLDPDIVAIYQIEIEDITNEAITYARSNAPFRGTASTIDIIGFATTNVK